MLKRFWNRDGRRLCAAALCVSMVLGNVANTAIAGDEGINTPYEFKLSSYDLYDAIQTAVSEDHRANLKEFQGTAAEDYRAMADSLDLFELNLSGADHEGALKLRAFAELSDEIEFSDEGVSEYILDGSEKIYFLLTNTSDLERKAVISVDEKKYTDVIKVAPAGAVEMDSVDPLLSAADFAPTAGKGGGSGSSGGGGGSSAGGPGVEISQETAAENSSEAETEAGTGTEASDDAGKETEASSEASTDTPTEASGEGSTDAPETEAAGGSGTENTDSTDGAGTEEAAPADGNGDAGNTGDAGTGTGNEENSGTSGEAGSDAGSDTGVDAGSDTGSDAGSDAGSDNSDASAGSDQSGSEQSSDNSGDSGENGSSDAGTVTASITRHNTYVVMSTATPSDSEEAEDEVDETETDDATDEATPSNAEEASPSNANADIIDGIVYRPVILDGEAVVLFETTVDEMALNEAAYDWAMDHGVTETYTSDPAFDKATVTVVARKGALPENVTLKVTELEGQEYQDAKDKLDEAATVYDGMMALDIRFVDASSGSEAEIEPDPEYGEVKVFIEMKQEALPADVAPENIEVQHLKEDAETGEIQVEKVADTTAETSGTVEVKEDDAVVAAEFAVESFSTFTITWNGFLASRTVTIKYVDEKGTEIPCTSAPTATISKDMGKVVDVNTYAYAIENRNFEGAHLGTVSGAPLRYIKAYYNRGHYRFKYSISDENWNQADNLADGSTILLVYRGEGTTPTPPEEIEEQKLAHDKYAVRREEDGTYDLTLTIAGQVGSITKKAKLDIVYVLDESGSMDYSMTEDWPPYYNSDTRREKAGDAINSLTNQLKSNQNLDTRFSLVAFSGENYYGELPWDDAKLLQDWTESASSITNKTKPSSNGGTNYQAGLRKAKELLKSSRPGALTAVIFVSDGDPTFRYDSNGATEGNGSNDNGGLNLNAAITEIGTLSANYFFSVGVGPSKNYQKLRALKDAAIRVNEENRNFYEGTDTTTLNSAFNSILAAVTTLRCTNVTVTDVLSKNVTMVTDSNNQPEALTITVKQSDTVVASSTTGELVVDGVTLTASYNTATKTITLDFPDTYELKKGYTYLVTAHIKPTEAAYEEYRVEGRIYNDKPGAGTGTHGPISGDVVDGLYSNADRGAYVTYTYNKTTNTESYLKPVIQIEPGTLTIEKSFAGLTEDEIESLMDTLKFSVKLDWKDENNQAVTGSSLSNSMDVYLKNMTQSSSDPIKYTYSIEGLSPNTDYTVSEVEGTANVRGYQVATTTNGTNGTIGKGGSATASFTNTYTKLVAIDVSKVVTGSLGDRTKDFPFTVSVTVNGAAYSDYTLTKNENPLQDNKSFTLRHGEKVVVTGVPKGATVRVSEAMADYTAEIAITGTGTSTELKETTTMGVEVVGVDEDTALVFTNTKNPTIDTGILLDSMPYVVILGIAIFGIAVYVVRKRKKDDSDLD